MTIGIIGLGLIGGSIAKALKKNIGCRIVAANRSEASLVNAKADGTIDAYSLDDMSLFSTCDVIFICTPVDKIPLYVKKLIPYIKKECIITDVGSTKFNIYKQMEAIGDICFIGGHPMAGSEKASYSAATDSLLEGSVYVLTPFPSINSAQLELMESLVKATGAKPIIMPAKQHDKSVAAISHAPHIVASALVNTVKELADENGYAHTLAAGGFKDITRIASSSPEVWNSICQDNKECILSVLKAFKANIEFVESALENDEDLSGFFSSARDYRNSFK